MDGGDGSGGDGGMADGGMAEGSNGLGGVAEGGGGSVGVADGGDGLGRGVHVRVGALDDGGGLPVLDDVMAADGGGDGHVVGPVHVHGAGHIDELLLVDGDVVGDLDGPLDGDGLVDDVGLHGGLDDGGVGPHGALEGGGHGDLEVGDGGLQDGAGVAGDEVLAAEVELLLDLDGGLGEDLDGGAGNVGGGVGSGHAHGGGSGDGHGGSGVEGHGGGSGIAGMAEEVVGGSGARGGKHGGENNLKWELVIIFAREQPKTVCLKCCRPLFDIYTYLPH